MKNSMNFELKNSEIESDKTIDGYIETIFNKRYISLKDLQEAKEAGFSLEDLLNVFCNKNGLLMHGSVKKIPDGDKIKSRLGKIFASDNSAIAIMRSIYSNENVNLQYGYYIDKNSLELIIHKTQNNPIITESGYLYLISRNGFANELQGSWQYIDMSDEVEIKFTVETEKEDFKYPIKVVED